MWHHPIPYSSYHIIDTQSDALSWGPLQVNVALGTNIGGALVELSQPVVVVYHMKLLESSIAPSNFVNSYLVNCNMKFWCLDLQLEPKGGVVEGPILEYWGFEAVCPYCWLKKRMPHNFYTDWLEALLMKKLVHDSFECR